MTGPPAHIWTGDDLSDADFEAVAELLRRRRQFDLSQYKDRCIRRRIAKRLRSEALMGLIWDRNTGGKFVNIEASRRIGNDWMLEIESRLLFSQSSSDPSFAISRDDYLELFLTYNF